MSDPSVRLEVSRIKDSDDLPVPPFPQPPELSNSATPVRGKLKLIQTYISSLEYNYTGEEFFVKKKDRGFRHVTSTAKLIIREALPIQCVEAVFVGAYLTASMNEVDRFPVCFRSSLEGRVYRHIILAVRSGKLWGALGLSRRDTLMYKELKYQQFSALMRNFRESYAGSWHCLEHIWVGFPLPHDISSNVPVKWKVMRADVGTESEWSSAAPKLDSYVACASSLLERFSSTGKIPDHPLLSTNNAGSDSGGNSGDPPSSPPSNTTNNESGDRCDDPRGSPGALSPGVRSPGFPPSWLGQENRAGRRRASTSVGKPVEKVDRPVGGGSGSGSGSCGGSGRGKGGGGSATSARRAGGGGSLDGTILVASPPRPRPRPTAQGGVRAAGTVTGKSRTRTTSKIMGKCVDAEGGGVKATGCDSSATTDGANSEGDVPAAQEKATGLLSSTPRVLPV